MMLYSNNESDLIKNYQAFTMNGADMSPAINEGDIMVADIDQKFIISGEIYILDYLQSIVACRLLLDRETVLLIFDNTENTIEEPLANIKILGRVIKVKTLAN